MTVVVLPPIRFLETPNQSRRLDTVRFLVVHRPVGSYAGTLQWCRNPDSQVSYHVVVREDAGEATQLVAWGGKSWACAGFNSETENICTPDHIWTEPWSPELARVMRVCARIVAFRLHKRGFPARHLTGSALLTGEGFARHGSLGKTGNPNGHACPTPTNTHPRWRTFRRMVEQELARGNFRRSWGRTKP